MSDFRVPTRPRGEASLFPTSIDESIADDHQVRYMDMILHSGPFTKVFKEWEQDYVIEGKSRPPYHPRLLAGLYFYGLLTGINSSRKLERACHDRIDVIWLMSGLKPDHTTISKFIKKNPGRLEKLFQSSVELGVKSKLITLNHVSIDGTKIHANASRDSVMREETIQKLIEKEVASRLEEYKKNDVTDNDLLMKDDSTASEKEKRLREAIAVFERRKEESSNPSRIASVACTTDPDARHMKDKQGNVGPNYNGQMSIDADSKMVVATGLSDDANDANQLRPQLEHVMKNCGEMPKEVSADSAYNTGPDLEFCAQHGTKSFMPDSGTSLPVLPEESLAALEAARNGATLTEDQITSLPQTRGQLSNRAFTFDEDNDRYFCPMNKTLKRVRQSPQKNKAHTSVRVSYRAKSEDCADCQLKNMCLGRRGDLKNGGRMVTFDQYESHRRELRSRMRTDAGRLAYRRRGHTAETPFALIKYIWKMHRFLRRGIKSTTAEWASFGTAINLSKLIAKLSTGAIKLA